jgi:hypothetical protein
VVVLGETGVVHVLDFMMLLLVVMLLLVELGKVELGRAVVLFF